MLPLRSVVANSASIYPRGSFFTFVSSYSRQTVNTVFSIKLSSLFTSIIIINEKFEEPCMKVDTVGKSLYLTLDFLNVQISGISIQEAFLNPE